MKKEGEICGNIFQELALRYKETLKNKLVLEELSSLSSRGVI